MAKNLMSAVATHVATGAEHVTSQKYEKRLEACNSCPNLVDNKQCGLCGCFVETKAKWASSTCPDNPQRWDRYVVGKNGKKINLTK